MRNRAAIIEPEDLPTEVLRRAPAVVAAATVEAPARKAVADALFDAMVQDRQSFWSVVYGPFMSRDLTRDDIRAIVRKGLERTSGNYKVLTELFNMPVDDYKRFLGFLRKYNCHMPFQQFRSAALSREARSGVGGDNKRVAASA